MTNFLRILTLAMVLAWLPACAKSSSDADAPSPAALKNAKTAIFAGGCFWCMEQAFDQVPGVLKTISGYTGGHVANPSYEQVSAGNTGHAEAEKIVYDPSKVSYKQLLDAFWHNVDPTDDKGQFCDRGDQYRSEIFYLNARQKKLAEASKKALQKDPKAPRPILTKIVKAGPFYKAEQYHQNYYKKNPVRYKYYHYACGRAKRLRALWGSQALGQE